MSEPAGGGPASRAVTVWSLELTDPARFRPATREPSLPVTIVRATAPGTSARFYAGVGADHEWTDRAHWTPDRWAAWEARVETHVALVEGEEAGYAELDPSGDGGPGCEIAYFGLLPAFQGLGIGGALLTHAIRRGFELAPRVWVHTCSLDGPHALANYRARGLEPFRTDTVLR